ncbi:12785_t:CDS:2 [Acaulospora colombiana]|uniref:12785_t:CDS:1 n=1 Tax=Acaulospora colombiana TaxID=27376 RepID=A0ACA9P8K5_9GLOM|nr:12785_t:CDS:2 [Acaulospora colombiana]
MAEQCLEYIDRLEGKRICCEREFWIGIIVIIDIKDLFDTLYNLQGARGIHGGGQVQPEIATILPEIFKKRKQNKPEGEETVYRVVETHESPPHKATSWSDFSQRKGARSQMKGKGGNSCDEQNGTSIERSSKVVKVVTLYAGGRRQTRRDPIGIKSSSAATMISKFSDDSVEIRLPKSSGRRKLKSNAAAASLSPGSSHTSYTFLGLKKKKDSSSPTSGSPPKGFPPLPKDAAAKVSTANQAKEKEAAPRVSVESATSRASSDSKKNDLCALHLAVCAVASACGAANVFDKLFEHDPDIVGPVAGHYTLPTDPISDRFIIPYFERRLFEESVYVSPP